MEEVERFEREVNGACRLILNHHGEEKQMIKSMEELSELIQAVSKTYFHGKDQVKNIMLDEIADVSIMLTQLTMIMDFTPKELQDRIARKINRQLDIIQVP